MSNDAYRTQWLKNSGVKDLSSEEKKQLEDKREEFLKEKMGLNEEIDRHYREIAKHKQEIEGLMGKIDVATPSIPGATIIHSNCGLKAAIPYGRTPDGGTSGGDDLGYCLYCGCDYLR